MHAHSHPQQYVYLQAPLVLRRPLHPPPQRGTCTLQYHPSPLLSGHPPTPPSPLLCQCKRDEEDSFYSQHCRQELPSSLAVMRGVGMALVYYMKDALALGFRRGEAAMQPYYFSQIRQRDLYRVRALLARQRFFAVPYRTVRMYSVHFLSSTCSEVFYINHPAEA